MMSIVYRLGEQKIVALGFEKVAQDVGIEFVEREVSKDSFNNDMTFEASKIAPLQKRWSNCIRICIVLGPREVRMVSPTWIVRWGEWVIPSFVKCVELFQ